VRTFINTYLYVSNTKTLIPGNLKKKKWNTSSPKFYPPKLMVYPVYQNPPNLCPAKKTQLYGYMYRNIYATFQFKYFSISQYGLHLQYPTLVHNSGPKICESGPEANPGFALLFGCTWSVLYIITCNLSIEFFLSMLNTLMKLSKYLTV
jgi:hypothetical protein